MTQRFSKKEKLKSKKTIEKLFAHGSSISVFPLRLIYLEKEYNNNNVTAKITVSVSKRQFKTAVARNKIKRLMREAYRTNKANYFNNITTQYAFMILYLGKDTPTFMFIETKMKILFKRFLENISRN